jgi:hypothetical protein
MALSLGQYTSVDVSDPAVEHVKGFVSTKLPLLFPDAREAPTIVSAERKTVAGYNLRLTLQFRRSLSLKVTLWVNVRREIQLTSLSPVETGRNLAGGWRWEAPDSLTDDDKRDLQALIAEQNGFGGEIAKVFAVRYQTVAGRNQHVIFSDSDGVLHSVVVYTNLRQERSVTAFQTVDRS